MSTTTLTIEVGRCSNCPFFRQDDIGENSCSHPALWKNDMFGRHMTNIYNTKPNNCPLKIQPVNIIASENNATVYNNRLDL